MSSKQQQILSVLRRKGEAMTKQELLEHFGHWYHHNAQKHLGEVLGRMVGSGLIYRPKRGYYELGVKDKPSNQMSLF